MEKFDELMMSEAVAQGEYGLKQLLQVWRDYYDEIFEINLLTGSYRTMMGDALAYWQQEGFVEIDVILLAEQRVHPDDKEAFSRFYDLDLIRENLNKGIYVSKLSFRLKSKTGEYVWVKVKNMIPTKQEDGTYTDSEGNAYENVQDQKLDEDYELLAPWSDARRRVEAIETKTSKELTDLVVRTFPGEEKNREYRKKKEEQKKTEEQK